MFQTVSHVFETCYSELEPVCSGSKQKKNFFKYFREGDGQPPMGLKIGGPKCLNANMLYKLTQSSETIS